MDIKSLKQYLELYQISGLHHFFSNNKIKPPILNMDAKRNEKSSFSHFSQNAQTAESAEVDNPYSELLKQVHADCGALQSSYKECTLCDLHKNRIRFVYGSGNTQARIMVIGEAPGADENVTGLPFVGKAGQLLTKMLSAIKLDRENDVYITNIVKCRPPNNRKPLDTEMNTCFPFLLQQIHIIQPKIILLLGLTAITAVLKINQTLHSAREHQPYTFEQIPVYVTYHPSALLQHPAWKREAWDDLQLFEKDLIRLGITNGR